MSSNDTKLSLVDVITCEVRLAFPSLFKAVPKSKLTPDQLTYQTTILIPPSEDLSRYKAAMKQAVIERWGDLVKAKLTPGKNPIHDCTEKPELEGYLKGWSYINLHSRRPPSVVDRLARPLTDPTKVYGGVWARVYMNAFTWEKEGAGRGVSFGLNSVQITRDDTPFGGQRAATDIFAPLGELADGGAAKTDPAVDDMFS